MIRWTGGPCWTSGHRLSKRMPEDDGIAKPVPKKMSERPKLGNQYTIDQLTGVMAGRQASLPKYKPVSAEEKKYREIQIIPENFNFEQVNLHDKLLMVDPDYEKLTGRVSKPIIQKEIKKIPRQVPQMKQTIIKGEKFAEFNESTVFDFYTEKKDEPTQTSPSLVMDQTE